MSLWCMACSPLMIAGDVRATDQDTAALLMNREVLAVNQDALGKPARRVKQFGPCEVWKKPLADGSLAVALINHGTSGSDVPLERATLVCWMRPSWRALFGRSKTWGSLRRELTQRVQPHQTILLKI